MAKIPGGKPKAIKTPITRPARNLPPVPPVAATPPAQPTGLAQATPAGAPQMFGSPANRPVNQTIGGVQQLPFKG